MKIIIERGKTLPFAELPDYSIALDGFCQGPKLDLERQAFSFDHHDGCIRLVTSATCKQVLDALLLGLDPEPFTIYVNDIDGDTVMAVWLLQNPKRVAEQRVRLLVDSVGAIDAHGPAYPSLSETLALEFYDFAMKPEKDARRSGAYNTLDLSNLLSDCLGNVTAVVDQYARKFEVKPEKVITYEITHTGKTGWVMAKSKDFIFDKLYKDGYTRAVAYNDLPDGSFVYTIGKKSDLVRGFPVGPHSKAGTLLHAIAAIEPGWGGGSTIGGAVRNPDGSRSHLTPDQVFEIIEGVLNPL